MKDQRLSVGRELDIELDGIHAELDGGAESGLGVLGSVSRGSAVSDDQRASLAGLDDLSPPGFERPSAAKKRAYSHLLCATVQGEPRGRPNSL